MKSCNCCWSLLLLLGFSQSVFIEIPQSSVNGTVGLSVLLPVLYSLQRPFPFPLTIQWHFSKTPNTLTSYTVTNCSVSAEGIPIHCSGNIFTYQAYQGRTVFFPENASLLLQNLQLNDSGVYRVTFNRPQQPRNITLTVSVPHLNRGDADGEIKPTKQPPDLLLGLLITGGLTFVLLLLFMALCCRWHRAMEIRSNATQVTAGTGQQKRMKIIKQQEVPNLEEFHMESSPPTNLSTIYAKIGEGLGQRQRATESQTAYASISYS